MKDNSVSKVEVWVFQNESIKLSKLFVFGEATGSGPDPQSSNWSLRAHSPESVSCPGVESNTFYLFTFNVPKTKVKAASVSAGPDGAVRFRQLFAFINTALGCYSVNTVPITQLI